jgi:epoxyqueuosine reductase
MASLANERHKRLRQNPKLLLEGARSIIVLGWPYTLTSSPPQSEQGLIAGYALQPDYHDHLPRLMQELVDFTHRLVDIPFGAKCVTDSAPLLERDLGQSAGLGWIGRNSCLISPRQGSSFLLAEILVTLDLPASQPFTADRCGTCRRCMNACPTGCIFPDRTLDAGKCISYLTIENKASIPIELRQKVENWVFGCDICQSVCPWNTKNLQGLPVNAEKHALSTKEMLEELTLSADDFKILMEGSPLLRAKWSGYRRNLIVVLTNLRQTQAIQTFTEALKTETDPEMFNLLTWAIERLQFL